MRNSGIDAVRVLGIVAVVAGHVWDTELSRQLLFSWHVPIFFFLSGYFWKTGRTVREELTNRWMTLIRPYLFWLAALGVLFLAVEAMRDDLTLRDGAGIVLGGAYLVRPFSAFWFVTALLIAAIFYRILERFPVWLKAAVVLAGLAAAYIAPGLVDSAPWSAAVAIPAMVFMYAGAWCRKLRSQVSRPGLTGIAMTAIGFGLALSGLSAPVDMKSSDFGTPGLSIVVAILISCGLTWIGDAFGRFLPATVGAASTKLAQVGFMVVLTHAAVLYVLNTPANRGWPDFALALVLPWVLALLLARTRAAAWTVGVPAPLKDQRQPLGQTTSTGG